MPRKSKRVPSTPATGPSGMFAPSTGVYREASSRSRCPRAVPDPAPARFQYVWLVRFTTVGASVTASYVRDSDPSSFSAYTAETSRRPGKPSSPAGLTRVSRSACSPSGSTSQTCLSKASSPPCRQFSPSLRGSACSAPSRANRAPAIRLA